MDISFGLEALQKKITKTQGTRNKRVLEPLCRGKKMDSEKLTNLSKVIKLGFESICIDMYLIPKSVFFLPPYIASCLSDNKPSLSVQTEGQTWSLPHQGIRKCSQVFCGGYSNPSSMILPTPNIYNPPVTSILPPQLMFSVWLITYTKLRSLRTKTTPYTK